MQLKVSISLSDVDAQNPASALECRLNNVADGSIFGGFTWAGGGESPSVLAYTIDGDFIAQVVDVDVEILSAEPFEYMINIEVD